MQRLKNIKAWAMARLWAPERAVAKTLPSPPYDEVHALCARYGQEHVLRFWDELSDGQRTELVASIRALNLEHADRVIKASAAVGGDDAVDRAADRIEPYPTDLTTSTLTASSEELKQWYETGLQLIGNSKVALLLMAGGQGTRLGFSAPKGCYDVGLPSHKSLYQLQAERIVRLQQLAGDKGVIPWYIMTSDATHDETCRFLKDHAFFGLSEDQVVMFKQKTICCIDEQGKILLETKSQISQSPDGNGGIYRALVEEKILEDMRARGVEHVHAYCVDNILVRVADPTFTGFAVSRSFSVATKVVRKTNPAEAVGLVVLRNGQPSVIEYTEISSQDAESKAGDLLQFRAANIVNHYYTLEALSHAPKWSLQLPYHVAKKKIPHVDLQSGEIVTKPKSPNGIKLEQFIFDTFPFIDPKNFGLFEVDREEEFSPLKNGLSAKTDNPATCRLAILKQGARWLRNAGCTVLQEEQEETGVEISPLVVLNSSRVQI